MNPLTFAPGVPHSPMTPEDIAEAYKAYRYNIPDALSCPKHVLLSQIVCKVCHA